MKWLDVITDSMDVSLSPPLSCPLPTLPGCCSGEHCVALAATLVCTDTSDLQGEEGGRLSGWATSGKSLDSPCLRLHMCNREKNT